MKINPPTYNRSLVPRPSRFIRHAKWSGRPGIASHMTWRKDREVVEMYIILREHYHFGLTTHPSISQRLRLVNGPRDKARLASSPVVSRALEVTNTVASSPGLLAKDVMSCDLRYQAGLPLHFACRIKLEGLGTRLLQSMLATKGKSPYYTLW